MEQYIVGMGEALWDILPSGKKIGGAPANFAYHVSQFGLNSCVVSAVGNDALGDEIVNNFTEKKLNLKIARVPFKTGTVQVEMDDVGVTRNTIHRFLDAMPDDDDRLRVFDINLRQGFYSEEIISDSISRCNILKINDEELVTVSRIFGYPGINLKDKCWILLGKYNLKMLILTCGVNGSYVFTPGSISFLPTPAVKVEDTVGAGDSFTAAFVSSILKGCPIKEAHNRAVQTSAYVCTQSGAMPVLPEHLRTF